MTLPRGIGTIFFLIIVVFVQMMIKQAFGFTFDIVMTTFAVIAFFSSFMEYMFFVLIASLALSWRSPLGGDMVAFVLIALCLFWAARITSAKPLAVLCGMVAVGIILFYFFVGGISVAHVKFLAEDIAVMFVYAILSYSFFSSSMSV